MARIRLASAEALGMILDVASLLALARAIAEERHPVVSQALLEAADRTLRRTLRRRQDPQQDPQHRTRCRVGTALSSVRRSMRR